MTSNMREYGDSSLLPILAQLIVEQNSQLGHKMRLWQRESSMIFLLPEINITLYVHYTGIKINKLSIKEFILPFFILFTFSFKSFSDNNLVVTTSRYFTSHC